MFHDTKYKSNRKKEMNNKKTPNSTIQAGWVISLHLVDMTHTNIYRT